MIIVNGFQPLTIIAKCSILDVATVLDPPLNRRIQVEIFTSSLTTKPFQLIVFKNNWVKI